MDNAYRELSDRNFCIEIVGHTDRVPFKKSVKKTNEQLSQERADAVKAALLSTNVADSQNYKAIGKGATECTTDKYQAANAPECRRVDVTLIPGAKCTQ